MSSSTTTDANGVGTLASSNTTTTDTKPIVQDESKSWEDDKHVDAIAKTLESEVKIKVEANDDKDKAKTISTAKKAEPDWADIKDEPEGGENSPAVKPAPQQPPNDEDIGEKGGIDPGDYEAVVQVLQADPNTPYYSASTFEELKLSDNLLKGVYGNKFNKPSKIQATSLPMILGKDSQGKYKNLIGQAHNGSGKTACFVLGMLSRVDENLDAIQALCVVPTRELARQIQEVIQALGKYTRIKVGLAIPARDEEKKSWRDKPAEEREAGIKDHIIVGTPGKIFNMIKESKTRRKGSFDVSHVKILVLDEADTMVDTQGLGDQTIRIKKELNPDVQILLFSATFADHVKNFASMFAPDANQITVQREKLKLDTIKQYYFECPRGPGNEDTRYGVLNDIYSYLTIGQSIIFVHTRQSASNLTNRLRADGHAVSLLYGGDMMPEERDRVIDEFRSGTTKVLITTNVLARGVDILQVTVVINYDLPILPWPTDDKGNPIRGPAEADCETYLHRIGRTGRFGRKGIAINFVHDQTSHHVLHSIEKYYGFKMVKVADVEELERRIQEL
eukprot:CAMPEP_0184694508 /NCGR_PEP_ID=MMETSP0313-20130426/2436_1 /TAXON_ID=2792 /ORGANISM="Porphyridium aerugineum, Strain SAG 1380-2" /LENGTH=561 /DNA_ID=CAMNT_0027152803 /DNA_START=139 /DNA_END=1824 /DNA_ORIENTATION=-